MPRLKLYLRHFCVKNMAICGAQRIGDDAQELVSVLVFNLIAESGGFRENASR